MIRFKVPAAWINDDNRSQDARLRIASILTGEGLALQKGRGVTWSLGSGNDWWLEIDPEKGEFEIRYRLGEFKNMKETMEALKTSLIFLLHIKDLQTNDS